MPFLLSLHLLRFLRKLNEKFIRSLWVKPTIYRILGQSKYLSFSIPEYRKGGDDMEYILQTDNLTKIYGTKNCPESCEHPCPQTVHLWFGGKKRGWKNHTDAYDLRSDTAK